MFTAVEGTTYWIAIDGDGLASTANDYANVTLKLDQKAAGLRRITVHRDQTGLR